MGTIIKRKRKDGSTSWLAQIAIRRAGKAVFRENRTFERGSIAAAWLEKREKDLAKPGALEDFCTGDHKRRDVTLANAIDRYVDDSAKAIGRTKYSRASRISTSRENPALRSTARTSSPSHRKN